MDEWAVPAEIDEAYVEKVILELERLRAEFFAILQDLPEGAEVPPEAIDLLGAFNTPLLAESTLPGYATWLDEKPSPLEDMLKPPGPRTPTRVIVGFSNDNCMAVVLEWTFEELLEDPSTDGSRSLLVLDRTEATQTNVTGWIYFNESEWDTAEESRDFTGVEGRSRCEG